MLAGTATGVKFKLKGDLARFPFTDAKQGDFRISANVQNASLAYVPPSLLPKNSLPWPALEQLNGELIIDHATLQARVDRGLLAGTAIQLGKAEGLITNIYDGAQLQVAADAKGPLADVLAVVNRSRWGAAGQRAGDRQCYGGAEYKLKLGFPLPMWTAPRCRDPSHFPAMTCKLPRIPPIAAGQGYGGLQRVQLYRCRCCRACRGRRCTYRWRIELASRYAGQPHRGAGHFACPGYRDRRRPPPSQGARPTGPPGWRYAGTAAYNLVLGLRSGTLEWQLNSSLVGMALALPAPFAKPAEQPLPLRLDNTAVRPAPGMASPQPLEQLRLNWDVWPRPCMCGICLVRRRVWCAEP